MTEDIKPQTDTTTKPEVDTSSMSANELHLYEKYGIIPLSKESVALNFFCTALIDPLTEIFTEISRVKYVTDPDSKIITALNVFDHHSKRLLRVSRNLIYAGDVRVGLPKLCYRHEDYATFVKELVADIRNYEYVKEVNINLTCDYENERSILDFTNTRYVLMNLIANAIYFAKDKADIDIHVSTDHKTITTTVQDMNGGIADHDIPHIFEEGYTGCVSGDNKATFGMGLGLFVAKNYAIQMRGDVTYEKIPGGSIFTFTLPFSTDKSENDYFNAVLFDNGLNDATDVLLAEVIKDVPSKYRL